MRRSASVTVTASLSEPSMSWSCSRVGVDSAGGSSSGCRPRRRCVRRAARAAAVAAAAPAANAANPVVLCRLQASELLADPASRHLEAIGGDAELAHEGQQRVAIVLDLAGQARQEPAEVRSLVLTGGAARELQARGGAEQMVVEVGGEVLGRGG